MVTAPRRPSLLLFWAACPALADRVNALSLKSILTADVVTCGTEEVLGEVLRVMKRNRIGCVVVVDEERRPCGIFTERDALALLFADGFSPARPVCEVMSCPVVSFPLSFEPRDAYQLMLANDVRHLVAVDSEGRVAGVMTEAKLLAEIGDENLVAPKTVGAAVSGDVDALGSAVRHGEFGRHMILGSVFDRIGDGVFLVDAASGFYVEANDRACELLGYARDEILGRHVWEVSTSFADAAAWRVWSAGLTEQVRVVNTDHRRRDGSLLPVEVRVYQVQDGERPLHVVILRDLSATRRIEAALREGERYYRHVIDSAVDGYFAMDPQRRFIEVNDTLCNLFGYPREEWLGQTPIGFIAEESRAELIAQMQRIDTTDRRRYQLFARRKDGTTFPILLNNTTHRNEKGEIVGSFGFITDLTPIVEAQRAVAESERELRGILDDLQDTYYRTDQTGTVVRASRSVEQLLGYTAE